MTEEDKIRNRVTYKRFEEFSKNLKKMGVPAGVIPKVNQSVYDLLEDMRAFRYRSASIYAQESIEQLKKDLKSKK